MSEMTIFHPLGRNLGGMRWHEMALVVGVEPATIETGVMVALLLEATAHADEGADVLKIHCARVFDRYNDSASGVRIAPQIVAIDSNKPVVEFVRTVVHQANISHDDTPGAVDVHTPKGFDGKGGKPIAVERRVHPVFLRDKENAIAGVDDTSRQGGRINVLYHTGRLV